MAFVANMTMHHNEEGLVFGQPNEYEAFLLSAELKKNSRKTYHASEDTLIVQKAIQFATTS